MLAPALPSLRQKIPSARHASFSWIVGEISAAEEGFRVGKISQWKVLIAHRLIEREPVGWRLRCHLRVGPPVGHANFSWTVGGIPAVEEDSEWENFTTKSFNCM